MPVPLSAIVSGEPGAVLVTETLPLVPPAEVGANFTVNDAVCPDVKVCGDSPLIVKPVPVMLSAVMDTLAVPEFVSVTATVDVFPTGRFPKLMLAGFGVSVPCVPVPFSGIVSGEFVAVDVIAILPETAPVAVGANAAVKDAFAPAAIVCPTLIPLALNPDPVVVILLIVIVTVPEFVSVMLCVLLRPTTTVLKLKLPGFALSVLPVATALPVIVRVCGEPEALSVKTMFPVAPVVDVGVN